MHGVICNDVITSMQDGLCSLLINAKSTYFTSVSQTTWIKLRIRYMGVDSKTRFACGMFGSRVLSYSVHGKPWIKPQFRGSRGSTTKPIHSFLVLLTWSSLRSSQLGPWVKEGLEFKNSRHLCNASMIYQTRCKKMHIWLKIILLNLKNNQLNNTTVISPKTSRHVEGDH